MSHTLQTTLIIASALAFSAVGFFLWKKKKHSFVRVGKISSLYFFPVKSLKAVSVKAGKCTKLGFKVNGLLDRAFMLVDKEGKLISQREEPSLVLLTPDVDGNILHISAPSGEELKVEIKGSISPEDTIVQCRIHADSAEAVDCGEKAAVFFGSYLKRDDVRLVRFFPSLAPRKYLLKNPFLAGIREDHPFGFQDQNGFHILSQAAIDDLNSKLDDVKVTVLSFRPNILVSGCSAYAEDSWNYIKFTGGTVMKHLMMTTRCILTTNNPETAILTSKEPLLTLRKYRISKDPEIIKKVGPIACFGVTCVALEEGAISLGDDIFAVVGPQPEMVVK